jgi:hypothetical protein
MWTTESHDQSIFSDPFGPSLDDSKADPTFEQTATTARQAVAVFRRLEASAMTDAGEMGGDPAATQRDPVWPNRLRGVTSDVVGDPAWRR